MVTSLLVVLVLAQSRPDAAIARSALQEGGGNCGGACSAMAILQTGSLQQKLLSMKLAGMPAKDLATWSRQEPADLPKFPFDQIAAAGPDDPRAIIAWPIVDLH